MWLGPPLVVMNNFGAPVAASQFLTLVVTLVLDESSSGCAELSETLP